MSLKSGSKKPAQKKPAGFGAAPLAPKYKRRIPLSGEDLPALKRIMKEIKGQTISLEEFILLIGPHTLDKGAALTKVMNADLSAFRRMVIEVYNTMTKDAADVMAVTQKELGQLYAEKQRLLVDNMIRCLQTIKDYVPDFDFQQYFDDPEKYLGTLFKLADIPDEEEIEVARRQLAYHRLQWLQSEGERLQAENVKLQERLNELKKIQRKDITESIMKEQEAERQRIELEQQQEQMQNELEELCDELHETIIASEKGIMDSKKEKKVKILAKKQKGPSGKSREQKEDWNVQVAGEYSKAQLQGQTATTLSETIGSSAADITKKSGLKKRVPLRAQKAWQQTKESTPAPSESDVSVPTRKKVKGKKKPAPKPRPVWQDVELDDFNVGAAPAEEQVPLDIFRPTTAAARAAPAAETCPPTCGSAQPTSRGRAPAPSPAPTVGRRAVGPRDTWGGFG